MRNAVSKKYLVGTRNTFELHRPFRRNGYFGSAGDKVTVDKKTAEWILERNLGEILSIEFDDDKVQYGASVRFMKL
jgi:hypothetical protein